MVREVRWMEALPRWLTASPLGLALLGVLALVLIFVLFLVAMTARQASQRGYSFLVWLLASILMTPFLAIIVLALLPDRRKKRLRCKEMEALETLLAQKAATAPARVDVAVPLTSVGDAPTIDPVQRSIGDEETRM